MKSRIAAVLILGFLAGSPAVAADWPQFLGPQRNATSVETNLLQTWPTDGPPLLWEKPVGDGYSGPVIAGKRLILFHRLGDEEVVECLDAAAGQPQWKFAYPTHYQDDLGKGDGPRSTPAIAGNRVYTLGAEGVLHCLDLETGKKVWARALQDDYHFRKGFFGVATSPLVEGQNVLINIGGPQAGIVALDRDTGKEVWTATQDEASYSSPVAATFDGVRQVLFLTRAGIVALEPVKGTILYQKPWRARLHASVNAAVPVVAGDLVFFSASYSTGAIVLQLKKDGVQELWKSDQVLSSHYNTSIHRDGFLYGIDGRQEGGAAQLRCVELKTGKVRWQKENFGCTSMILAGELLLALRETGELVLIEATPEAYRQKARAQILDSPCRAEIALANARLYARGPQKLGCWSLKK